MGTNREDIRQLAYECGLEINGFNIRIINDAPCGNRRDDFRNIASDMRRAINRYFNGKA